MYYIIYLLIIISLSVIIEFLNFISKGNMMGIGLGDFIMKNIGLLCTTFILIKMFFKKNKKR